MASGKDYLREVQKFTTSQYWSTGARITAGVMLPTLVLAKIGWLAEGMPFLWGSLFVSITDMAGPIHHRRNGMLTAVALNSATVFITSLARAHPVLLLLEISLFAFFFSLLGVYGSRAGAVGTLALVMMLLNLIPHKTHASIFTAPMLVAAGGLWYTFLSLSLYKLRPYRLAEQAIGEQLITIAQYVRSRASLYNEEADLQESFSRIMHDQVDVQHAEEQTRELLYKTRQFVTDASPKSRCMMMIFLDAMDLFENSLHTYQDYTSLQTNLKGARLLEKFRGVILQLAAEIEHVGFRVQAGQAVKKNIDLTVRLQALEDAINQYENATLSLGKQESLRALKNTISNVNAMANRLQRIVLFTRLEVSSTSPSLSLPDINKDAAGQQIKWSTLRENLTMASNNFRYSLRLTLAMLAGFGIASLFSLTHAYWVLLTILTILRPVYTQTRRRNLQRLGGTFAGAFLAIIVLALLKNTTVLLVVMVLSMLLAYSFLRVNYFSFVFFLTLFIILTFHFLDPGEINQLIRERLLDTFIGSVLAGIAARFILPIWEHEQIETAIGETLSANRAYFKAAWAQLNHAGNDVALKSARTAAVVALTNLSDKFQKMLSEPHQTRRSPSIHQMVIANHMLAGHIGALAISPMPERQADLTQELARAAELELLHAENQIRHLSTDALLVPNRSAALASQALTPLSIIYSLSHDIRLITQKLQTSD